jgi:hypothetical protein
MAEMLENIENIEIMEENIEMKEESVFDKIEGLKAEVNQMERMIEENIRMIEKGDDVEGRTYLKKHLESEVVKKKEEIVLLENQL